jgi:4-hydroxythreonine-4-phosphate dehydrogenase
MSRFVFTCGDVNGIGPEIVVKTLNKIISKKKKHSFIFLCPLNVFKSVTALVKPSFEFNITDYYKETEPGILSVINTGNTKLNKGKATESSGITAYNAIELSFALLKSSYADSVITAPISKTALKMGGIEYPGHTEMYADWCGTNDYAMVFLSKQMNAALATIHSPIKNVSSLITTKRLRKTAEIVTNTLTKDLIIKNPKIAVLGLNPHAGENGLIGREEEEIIKPLLKDKKYKNFSGPYSPDAFFANKMYKNFDMILGMYHDQVLIPFKLMNFNEGVNYTAGLPVVRTSPDHGTAYDIAWQNKADESSMLQAFLYAEKIVRNRRQGAAKGN